MVKHGQKPHLLGSGLPGASGGVGDPDVTPLTDEESGAPRYGAAAWGDQRVQDEPRAQWAGSFQSSPKQGARKDKDFKAVGYE